MNILIVDDSKILRNSLKLLITSKIDEARVHEAQDVKHALKCIENALFDVIILDILLPDGTGFEVLEIIRNRNLASKVIILSNYATAKFRQKAAEKGADHFFDKSSDYEDLVHLIRNSR